ncbi:Gfo/Idh/MocA family protein [Streptomyces sp. NPDC059010]|uniref:Gfo/Idh/MocA family protein n=1 Tax=Streptomyces sp. NPDC059010 TaxID=3346695 RepID=UPI0036C17E22
MRSTNRPLGVGLLASGPVTQAVHLPTLATLAERLHVTHVMGVTPDVVATVAARVGARYSSTVEELLADESVDVVAVCSPNSLHAEHVVAALSAGKRGVLCEKPLATSRDEVEQIARAASSSGVPLVVGAMHAYDPAWTAAKESWGDLPDRTHLVRSRVYLPPNEEFVDLATDLATGSPPPVNPPTSSEQQPSAVDLLRGCILGLATHVIPQLRHFMPGRARVVSAELLEPFGYRLVLTGEGDQYGRTAELFALLPGAWEQDWTFEAWAPDTRLRVDYPPPYVLAGSARVTLTDTKGSACGWQFPSNGYQAEWLHLADVVEGRTELMMDVPTVLDDMLYALDMADDATALLKAAS